MNWYQMFYWLSVVDKVSGFIEALAIITLILFVLSTIVYLANVGEGDYRNSNSIRQLWRTNCKRYCFVLLPVTIICWFTYIFLPSKRDLVLIVAGGAVGQFVEGNKDAKAIPAEVMTLLRTKIKSEINSVSINDVINKAAAAPEDTLKAKTKPELIKLVKEKNALLEQ